MRNAGILLVLAVVLIAGCGQPAAKAPTPSTPPAAAQPTPPAPAAETAAKTAAPAAETTKQSVAAAPKKVEGPLTDTLTPATLPAALFMTIKVKDYGTMKLRFCVQEAPQNVANVANRAVKGLYNGLTFHRLIPGFMIQGGDPKGTGAGDVGYTVPAEFSSLKHLKGTVAMARLPDQVNPKRASSGCQFYICFAPAPFLDGQYTIIGKLVSGEDVLDKLEKVPTGPQDRPRTPVLMESVTVTTQ